MQSRTVWIWTVAASVLVVCLVPIYFKFVKDFRWGFLTIGIPYPSQDSVKGDLARTLRSLIQNIGDKSERSRVTIVVFACDLDQPTRQEARSIVSNFTEHVQSGFLQLIEAPRSLYPENFEDERGNSSSARAKRNTDTAFLLAFAAGSSEYYLQLTDNVHAYPNYVNSIREFIEQQEERYWVTLEFSRGGFTGKLVRAGGRDLLQLVHLLVEFNTEQPTETLYRYFKKINVQKDILRNPPLFETFATEITYSWTDDKADDSTARHRTLANPPKI